MTKILDSVLLAQLSDLITTKMGLYFPQERWHDLERGLIAAADSNNFVDGNGTVDLHAYAHALVAAALTPSQIESLAAHLTIGETYFFREKPTFHALREYVLPELIHARRATMQQLRVWSAGCCTGEEAYSSAILLNQLLPDRADWVLNIVATDINPRFLRRAEEGIYGEWSFRDVPAMIKAHYFTQTNTGRWEILPAIKRQVKFSTLNLVDDSYPSRQNNIAALDVILCRNVLMYFSREQAKRVVRKLYDSLVEGGWLIVSMGEASHELFADFEMVHFPNAILYRKRSEMRPFATSIADHWQRQKPAEGATASSPSRAPMAVPTPSVMPSATPSIAPILPSQNHPRQARQRDAGLHSQEAEARGGQDTPETVAPDTVMPDDAAALAQLAYQYADLGQLDAALAWCNRSLALDSLNLRAHYLYAMIQQARGEIEEAIQALQRTIYLHPTFIMAHLGLGTLARQQGKTRQADKHFTNLLTLLQEYQPQELLPESDGLTAGELAEMVRATSPHLAASTTLPHNKPQTESAR